MASCINRYGKPKIRHNTEQQALDQRNALLIKHPDDYYSVYFCYVCYSYHVGHRKQPKDYDDVLVGKLIGAIKRTINGN